MKKLNSIESNENFNEMVRRSNYIINELKELNDDVLQDLL